MSVLKALETPETVYTPDGKIRATHETYSYVITPFHNPPIKVSIHKGHIDRNGLFKSIPSSAKSIDLTPEEFKELISPTPEGKPAGDFRLSDILRVLKKRLDKGAKEPTPEAVTQPEEATTPAIPEASEIKSE